MQRALTSFDATIEAAKLAVDIIKSIRATFAKSPSERKTFELIELVLATVPLVQVELNNERILLELELDETLPPVLADQVQLQQVLINLLTNAIESVGATENRSRHIVIRSTAVRSEGLRLEVSDNGAGIAPEDLDRIFDPFFTTKPTGNGLGLSLCRIIVEAHGGRLWASAGEEHGATFHMELPCGGVAGAHHDDLELRGPLRA